MADSFFNSVNDNSFSYKPSCYFIYDCKKALCLLKESTYFKATKCKFYTYYHLQVCLKIKQIYAQQSNDAGDNSPDNSNGTEIHQYDKL